MTDNHRPQPGALRQGLSRGATMAAASTAMSEDAGRRRLTGDHRLHPIPGAAHLDATEIVAALIGTGYSEPQAINEEFDQRRTNQISALQAAGALRRYAELKNVKPGTHEPLDVLRDLLNDLHHLADALGVDWDEALRQYHYDAETGVDQP